MQLFKNGIKDCTLLEGGDTAHERKRVASILLEIHENWGHFKKNLSFS